MWSSFTLPREMDAYRHWNAFAQPGGGATPDHGQVLPLVFQLANQGQYQRLMNEVDRLRGLGGPGPYVSDMNPNGAGDRQVVVYAKPDDIADLVALRNPQTVVIEESAALPEAAFPAPFNAGPSASYPGLGPDAVISGVIDFGMAIANARFRAGLNESRIAAFWNMNASEQGGSVPHHQEFLKAQIDAGLAAHTYNGIVDEEAFNRAFGLAGGTARVQRPAARSRTHGTFISDLAAGEEMGPGDRNPIIAVQLPAEIVGDTYGVHFNAVVREAVSYIMGQAGSLSAEVAAAHGLGSDFRLPVVINISFGTYAGRHDGLSTLERYFDDMIGLDGLKAICLPVGNGHESRSHARYTGAELASPQQMMLRVQPDSRLSEFVQVWLPAGVSGADLALKITPPLGPELDLATIVPGTVWEWDQGGVTARLYQQEDVPEDMPGEARVKVTLALRPSESAPTGGAWMIRVAANLAPEQVLDMWVERGDTPDGFVPKGRQAYFDDPEYRLYNAIGGIEQHDRPEARVKRAGTISPIATGRETTVLASHRAQDFKMSTFSSAGPVTAQVGSASYRDGPDLSYPSEKSAVRDFIGAAGSASGSVRYYRGTSFSSAMAARAYVGMLMADPSLTPAALRTALKAEAAAAEANASPGTRPAETAERMGAGRL
ncbi:hypothetical protein FHS89_000628 [Rubricella aquisinus]|uniref:Peptidase S8/S53 domain-containing protein n=1 Tax=Rubricella aquisinus TaxID=2028108 RepID=A0A840WTT7_9RHOB|nr:S8 family serine peptidase [Rubricella aquisinus]MBB5514630.1 hypothetical protein [Rubricella aquisinus]